METLSYTDFSSKILSTSSDKRIPLGVSLELTYRCNNKCGHCYCNLPIQDRKAIQEELTTAEIMNLLDELAAMGSLWLLITGGEPMLRKDFKEIYVHAKKRGFIITLFTNGTLVDESTTNLLSKYPPFVVEITLYGATKNTYENVTNVKGSYEKCIEGIKRITDAKIKLELKAMAISVNYHEIELMDKFAQQLGCEFRFDPAVHKRIDDRMLSQPENLRLSPEEVVKLDLMFPKRMIEMKRYCEQFVGKPVDSHSLYTCGAGKRGLHIDPYGMIMGCGMTGKNGFHFREHSLQWIWDEGISSVINQKKDFLLPCDACDLENLCGQCVEWRILENGDMTKEVAYLCNIAKMRQRRFAFLEKAVKGES